MVDKKPIYEIDPQKESEMQSLKLSLTKHVLK